MNLERKDILLEKLRNKYLKAAEKYGKNVFNMEQLESRIQLFQKNKGDINNFLTQEMEFFETTKKIAQSKVKSYQKMLKGETRLDKMLAKNEAKIKKYPVCFFDPFSSVEMRHFVGAITDFYKSFYNASECVIRGNPIWNDMAPLFGELERFCVFSEGSKPIMLRRYTEDILQSKGQSKERIDGKYFQTAGLSLYRIHLIYKKSILEMNEHHKESKIDHTVNAGRWVGETYAALLSDGNEKK